MKYAIVEESKCTFIDDDRQRLVDTLAFIPEKTEADIVELADDAVVQGYDGNWYLAGYEPPIPADVALQNAKDDRAVAVEAINATVNGNIYDGDEISQGRMARAVVFAMVRADIINRERRIAYEQAIAGLTPEETEAVPKPVYDDYLDYTIPWVTEDNQVIQTTIGQLGTAGGESMLTQAGLWTVPYES